MRLPMASRREEARHRVDARVETRVEGARGDRGSTSGRRTTTQPPRDDPGYHDSFVGVETEHRDTLRLLRGGRSRCGVQHPRAKLTFEKTVKDVGVDDQDPHRQHHSERGEEVGPLSRPGSRRFPTVRTERRRVPSRVPSSFPIGPQVPTVLVVVTHRPTRPKAPLTFGPKLGDSP